MTLLERAPTLEKAPVSEVPTFDQKTQGAVNTLRRSRSLFELTQAGKSRKEAIEITALSLAESEDQDLSESEKNLFRVIGYLGSFVPANRQIQEIREGADESGGWLSNKDKQEISTLRDTALTPFNHAIKELINTDSSTVTKDELDVGLTRLYMQLFYRDDPSVMKANEAGSHDPAFMNRISKDAFSSISACSSGMRNEIAAETMLSAAGIDYDYQVSVQEDGKGIDLFVYIDEQWHHIDIKASELTAQEALKKRPRSHAVWTGLRPNDFRGTKDNQVNALRISFATAMKFADGFVDRIRSVMYR